MKHQELVTRSYEEVLDRLSTLMIVLVDDARHAQDRKAIDAILERHTIALQTWRLLQQEQAEYQQIISAGCDMRSVGERT